MNKLSIPQVPKAHEPRSRFDQAIKENLEIICGQRNSKVNTLTETASQADIIAKINELIALLQ